MKNNRQPIVLIVLLVMILLRKASILFPLISNYISFERIARIYPLPHEEKISISLIDCTLWAWPKQRVCNVGISRIKTLIKEKLLILEGLVTILHDMRTLLVLIRVRGSCFHLSNKLYDFLKFSLPPS